MDQAPPPPQAALENSDSANPLQAPSAEPVAAVNHNNQNNMRDSACSPIPFEEIEAETEGEASPVPDPSH